MKRLMTIMLALSFVLGSVAVVFAQDTATKTDTTKKKAKKKKTDAPKKDTGR
jgi:Ni/Co efflux regulator RcnB